MADISKVKLPDNTTVNIKDSRISGIDSTPTSSSGNIITSGGVYSALSDYLPLSGGDMDDGAYIRLVEADGQSEYSTSINSAIIQINNEIDGYRAEVDGCYPGFTAKSNVGTVNEKTVTFFPDGINYKPTQSAQYNLLTFPAKTGTLALTSDIPTVDSTPTSGSTNAVSSGGVYTAINSIPSLPSVTASDNDKILKVVNGAWASASASYLPTAGGFMNNGTTATIKWSSTNWNSVDGWNVFNGVENSGLAILTSTVTGSGAPTRYAVGLHVGGYYGMQISVSTDGNMYYRFTKTDPNPWKQLVTTTELGSYLPLTGGTLTGPLELTPTAATATSSDGIDFGNLAHIAANTGGDLALYADGGVYLRPGNGAFSSNYGLGVTSTMATFSTNVVIASETSGTPMLTFRRGGASDGYADWKQKNNGGIFDFIRSVNGTDTSIFAASSTSLYPVGTLTDTVSDISLGSSTNQWAGIYANNGTFSGNVTVTGTVTATNVPNYYTGTTDPSSSLGNDGDIYIKISS